MKVTRRQLRKIIKEGIMVPLQPFSEGYMVPEFHNTESMQLFLDELEPEEEVEQDVMDPETGEIWILAGETMGEQEWFEGEVEDVPEETEPDELDRYDWDAIDKAYEKEREEEQRKQDEQDEKFQNQLRDDAEAGGKDWGADTLSQARHNPSMWKDGSSYQQWDSPEDYVLGFGQDAAGDVAQSVEYSMDSNEMYDWYKSLPDHEVDRWADRWRITKQGVKDLYADYFYDGVAQAVKEAKAA